MKAHTTAFTLPDGSVRELPAGSSLLDLARAIGPGLAKAAVAAVVDGEGARPDVRADARRQRAYPD